MKLSKIISELALTVFNESVDQNHDVNWGYTSDLLSDVMGHAREGEIWITLQSHTNVAAIASLKDLAAIVLVKGTQPDESMLQKGSEAGIPLLGTRDSSFIVSGKIYELLK